MNDKLVNFVFDRRTGETEDTIRSAGFAVMQKWQDIRPPAGNILNQQVPNIDIPVQSLQKHRRRCRRSRVSGGPLYCDGSTKYRKALTSNPAVVSVTVDEITSLNCK
jgi:hypothetical protein